MIKAWRISTHIPAIHCYKSCCSAPRYTAGCVCTCQIAALSFQVREVAKSIKVSSTNCLKYVRGRSTVNTYVIFLLCSCLTISCTQPSVVGLQDRKCEGRITRNPIYPCLGSGEPCSRVHNPCLVQVEVGHLPTLTNESHPIYKSDSLSYLLQ
jgi:hypothetical protein